MRRSPLAAVALTMRALAACGDDEGGAEEDEPGDPAAAEYCDLALESVEMQGDIGLLPSAVASTCPWVLGSFCWGVTMTLLVGRFAAIPRLTAFLVCSALIASCATQSPNGESVAAGAGVAAGWTSAGQVPLSARRDAIVVWDGSGVLVFGGRELREDRRLVPLSDGARYDLRTDTWEQVPSVPFDPGLAFSTAIGTGDGALIVGVACRDISEQDAGVTTCDPGGYAAGFLDSVSQKSSVVDLPDDIAAMSGEVPTPQAVGWTGSEAVVDFGGSLRGWSPKSSSWRTLPKPPIDWRDACVVGDQILVVGYTDEVTLEGAESGVAETGSSVLGQPHQDSRVVASISALDADASWSGGTAVESGTDLPLAVQVVCTGDGPLTLVTESQPGGGSMMFDVASRSWRSIASPAPEPGYGALEVPTAAGVVLAGDNVAVVYESATGSWRELPAPTKTRPEAGVSQDTTVFMLVRLGTPELVLEWLKL